MLKQSSRYIPPIMIGISFICFPLSVYYLYPVWRNVAFYDYMHHFTDVLHLGVIPGLFFLSVAIITARLYITFKKDSVSGQPSKKAFKSLLAIFVASTLFLVFLCYKASGYHMSFGSYYVIVHRNYPHHLDMSFLYQAIYLIAYIWTITFCLYFFLWLRHKEQQAFITERASVKIIKNEVAFKNNIASHSIERLILLGFILAIVSTFMSWNAQPYHSVSYIEPTDYWLDGLFHFLSNNFSMIIFRPSSNNESGQEFVITSNLSGFDVSFYGYVVLFCATVGALITKLPYFRLYFNTTTIRIIASLFGLIALFVMCFDKRFGLTPPWSILSVNNFPYIYSRGPLTAITGLAIALISCLIAGKYSAKFNNIPENEDRSEDKVAA